jgi:hypothetical protein
MNGAHWSEQDLVNHIYGVGPDAAHLDGCKECRARADAMAVRRQELARDPGVSIEFLAAQRRSIYRRLGRDPRQSVPLMPAFAAVLMVLISFLVFRPAHIRQEPVAIPAADTKLVSDMYALEQSPEPQAVETLHALFEEN